MASGRMGFLRLAREQLDGPTFLADRTPGSADHEASVPLGDVLGMAPATGPLHFIFHTAFCRSTLLVRALDLPGISAGLSEPGIIGSLAGAGRQGAPLVKPVLDLLSRRHGDERAVIVKPTNHANMLIPALLDARPDARGVLMTSALDPFLLSVAKRGMMGRRWGRQLYFELMGYAGVDLGMDGPEQFAMTDLQAAGLAWFLNRRYFSMLRDRYGERLIWLDGDRFDAARAATLLTVSRHFALDLTPERADAVASGDLFSSHAKLGGDFDARRKSETERAASRVTEEEIAQVGEWIGLIARQAGVDLTLGGN